MQVADHSQEIEKTDEEGRKAAGGFGENGEDCNFISSAIVSILFLPFALSEKRRGRVSAWRTQPLRMSQTGESIRLSVQKTHLLLWRAKSFSTWTLFVSWVPLCRFAPVGLALKQYLHISHALVETVEGQQTFPDRALAQLARNGVSCSVFHTSYRQSCHRSDRFDPHSAPQIDTDDCSDGSYTRRGTAARDQSLSVFRGLASATHY